MAKNKVKTKSMPRLLRQRFHNAMLQLRSGDPFEEFSRMASYWSDVTGASWSWIWLKNSHTETWEIVGVGRNSENQPENQSTAGTLSEFPDDIPVEMGPNSNSIAEMVTKKGESIFVKNVSSFCEDFEGIEYDVCNAEWFLQNHIESFETIPFEIESESYGVTVQGVACCHFGNSDSRVIHEQKSLSIMGGLTGQAIANVYESLFFRLILKLNNLAATYPVSYTHLTLPTICSV